MQQQFWQLFTHFSGRQVGLPGIKYHHCRRPHFVVVLHSNTPKSWQCQCHCATPLRHRYRARRPQTHVLQGWAAAQGSAWRCSAQARMTPGASMPALCK